MFILLEIYMKLKKFASSMVQHPMCSIIGEFVSKNEDLMCHFEYNVQALLL